MTLTALIGPMARADHIFEAAIVDPPIAILPAPTGNRVGILGPCLAGITDVNFPANTGFFVAHGWTYYPWNESTPAEKRAFTSMATVFRLWIDGVLQTYVMHTALVNFPEGQYFFSYDVTENGHGLAGTHVFLGRWFYDASDPSIGGDYGVPVLQRECTVTVHFVL